MTEEMQALRASVAEWVERFVAAHGADTLRRFIEAASANMASNK